jgi:hypothetical protein
MKVLIRNFFLTCWGVFLTSCIQFEREVIQYRHDASADELRMTLNYEGISGGKGSQGLREEASHDPRELSARQVEQIESVIKGGRAFFFENWIFEYDRSSIRKALKELSDGELEHENILVGVPEKKFLQISLEEIELTNLGFYLNENKRLCGTQTLVIKRFSKFLETTNEMIRRQVVHGIECQLAKVESGKFKPKDAPSAESTALLITACKKKHDFLLMKKGRLVVRVPLGKREYLEFKKEILGKKPNSDEPNDQHLPTGIAVNYKNKMLTLALGDEKQEGPRLTKKCHSGYFDNALRYLRTNHPEFLGQEAEIASAAKRFLTGGD